MVASGLNTISSMAARRVGGGGLPPTGAKTGRLRPNRLPFQASGIRKGRDFTS